MRQIKISAKYWNGCTQIEKEFITNNAAKYGVQSCKNVLNLLNKATKETLLTIKESGRISLGGEFIAVYNDFKLTVQLSSGWIGDTHKVYKVGSNNNLIQVI